MNQPPNRFRRRTLLKGMGASALLPLLSANLIGCSDSSDSPPPPEPSIPEPPIESVPATFEHGVASGDPLEDRVILWTRVSPEREGNVVVAWEIASDEAFSDIVASGDGSTTADVDYTVKVDVTGLNAGSDYYYRFTTGDNTSPVGRTRTAPTGSLATASFAVVSCSNYPAGFFHVYREIADRDVDAVLHLGDYIYEYGANGYASEDAEALGRVSVPADELISLDDYRVRYAQYHGDRDLQDCHARHPFIIVWDDHEVANDTYRNGAQNHQPDTEGEFSERRAAAIQAWFEWLPVRPPSDVSDVIYRQLSYGDLVDLFMLDTRQVGRDQQLDYADFISGEMIDVAAIRAATGDSTRTLLGAEQLDWLKGALTNSEARWQVLGQQVLMARQTLPEPVMRSIAAATATGNPDLDSLTPAVIAALQAKSTPEDQRTPEQQALLDSAIPFNLDAWDGYGFERDDLLEHARQLQSRLVVLAGDTHNGWASQLTTADGSLAGVEFACASVSSPGFEGLLGGADNAALFSGAAVTLIDDLRYANFSQRGYVVARFEAESVTAEWVYVDTIKSAEYTVDVDAGQSFTVDNGTLLLG
ncbi:alkaline phosphatase [Parahaliea maris]|uniref:Alkaline phosphatase n=1 Tax=Parahaliea maris TaxID=2716870 RepID=A0A5C9A5C9_9GAMM|nr:alkaline phosphatase D family protein [Parahaliea maris]TXS95224.1 alkaline phosphatase [Parahaliea maris]